MKARRQPRIGPGEIIIFILIGLLALVVITGNLGVLWQRLYSGYAVSVIVIMLVEYLLLKGSDRSPIYRRELEAARVKRRDDLLALRDLEGRLVELHGALGSTLEKEPEPAGLRAAVENARGCCEVLLRRLRERI